MSEVKPMNLSEVKRVTETPGDFPYERAHREVSKSEQERPCTCQMKARVSQGSASFPALFSVADADPDCELYFPWVIEDDVERLHAMRWWLAGYSVGHATASATADEGGHQDDDESSTPELLDPEGSGYVPEPPWDDAPSIADVVARAAAFLQAQRDDPDNWDDASADTLVYELQQISRPLEEPPIVEVATMETEHYSWVAVASDTVAAYRAMAARFDAHLSAAGDENRERSKALLDSDEEFSDAFGEDLDQWALALDEQYGIRVQAVRLGEAVMWS